MGHGGRRAGAGAKPGQGRLPWEETLAGRIVAIAEELDVDASNLFYLYPDRRSAQPRRLVSKCISCSRILLHLSRDRRLACDSCRLFAAQKRRGRISVQVRSPVTESVREQRRATRRRRDYLKRQGGTSVLPPLSPEREREIRARARSCALCRCRLVKALDHPRSKHLDHVVPFAVGGAHVEENVRVVCRTCNLSRPWDASDVVAPVSLFQVVSS